jgi:hypothetical protein
MKIAVLTSTLALVSLSSATAQSAPRSIAMTTRMTIDSGLGPQTFTTRTLSRGTRYRMDIEASSMPHSEGMFMVFDAADSSMLSVSPSSKMATIMKLPSFTGTMESPKVTSSGTRDTTIDLGSSEPILGFATHHYRYLHSGTSTTTYADRICTTTMHGVRDEWTTEDTAATSMYREANRAAMQGMGSMLGDRLRQGSDSGSRRRSRGVTLRSVSVDSTDRTGGAPVVMTVTSETTELSRMPLDSTLFVAPAGYQLMDMRAITISGDMSAMMKGLMKNVLPMGCVSK